jgi:hypothetical protein
MKYLLAQQSLQLAFARSHQANFDKPGGLGTLSGFQQLNWSGGGGGGGLLQPQISAPATITQIRGTILPSSSRFETGLF